MSTKFTEEQLLFKVLVDGVERIIPLSDLKPFLKGLDGRDGVDGKDGIDGKTGPAGKDGIDGKDGKDCECVNTVPKPPATGPVKLPKPWPEFKILDGALSGNFTRTRSLLLTNDGKSLVGLPYHGHDGKGNGIGLHVDLENDVASGYNFANRKGYMGSCLHSSGKQVAFPAYAMGYAVLDKDDKFEHIDWPYKLQLRSGAEAANGKIYSASFTSNPMIATLDLDTNKIIYKDSYVRDKEDGPRNQHHWGAVAGGGKVYLLPWWNDKVGMINMANDSAFELVGDPITGGHENRHAIGKFTHGVYHKSTGLIVSLPRQADTILLIDTKTDTHEEVPLPKGLVELLGQEFASKSFGCVVGPDDLVYSCPWGFPIQFRFDPVTKEVEWRDLTEDFAKTNWIKNGTGITTDARLIGDSIYFGSGAGSAIKMKF